MQSRQYDCMNNRWTTQTKHLVNSDTTENEQHQCRSSVTDRISIKIICVGPRRRESMYPTVKEVKKEFSEYVYASFFRNHALSNVEVAERFLINSVADRNFRWQKSEMPHTMCWLSVGRGQLNAIDRVAVRCRGM